MLRLWTQSLLQLAYGTGTAWTKPGEESQLDQACLDGAKTAMKLGYYHLDGAEVYKTETELGIAIKESGVARDKLYLVTKVMTSMADIPNALRTSLKKLQTDYVDLYLIHSPFFAETKEEHQAKWKQMEQLKKEGLAKSIGVSNYLPEVCVWQHACPSGNPANPRVLQHLDLILDGCEIPPAINQIEFHIYLQHPDLIAYHKAKGIATSAYGPLTPVTKATGGPVDDLLAALSKKYAVNPGEICLRWCIDQDVVPVTTSGKEQRLSDYLRAMTFKLTPKEIQQLNEEGAKKHFRGFWNHKYSDDDRR